MPLPRRLSILLAAIVLYAIASPHFVAASRIGLYTDASGSSCSFSGNDPGMVTAYVVLKADGNGVLGARFSVPAPSCFGATFLYDTPGNGVTVIGSSQTGVSTAFQSCVTFGTPALALSVTFFRNGSTTPCCEFPIAPDPIVGAVEITDCSFGAGSVTTTLSHLNADGSCPCVEGTPPQPPSQPSPSNAATGVSLVPTLTWSTSPVDTDILNYDVYIGTTSSPAFVQTTTQHSFQPALPLQTLKQYYWRVVVRDADGLETSGPTWTFTTKNNLAPSPPNLTYPLHGSTLIPLNVTLTWTGSDPDGDALKYDVYFGQSETRVAQQITATQWTTPTLQYSTAYQWKIVAFDPYGHSATSGPINFTTRPVNMPPVTPSPLYPAHQATGVPVNVTLSWSSSDEENEALTYDLYFGTATNPPLIASGLTAAQSTLATLNTGVTYRWKVVVHDTAGNTTTGPVWRFTTVNSAPTTPSSPGPGDGATNVATTDKLTWQSIDPEGNYLSFDVYLGTTVNPPKVAVVGYVEYNYADLFLDTTYYWKIVARDTENNQTTGPLWSFHTRSKVPPTITSWGPQNAAVDVAPAITLMWHGKDEASDPLTYDVYFGIVTPPDEPPLVASGLTQPYYAPGPLATGTTYHWRVVPRDAVSAGTPGPYLSFTTAGTTTAAGNQPLELGLGRNHPNPFNPQTIIPYTVPSGASMHVRIAIFDAVGRRVRTLVDETQSAGAREVVWRGENEAGAVVSSGIYYCVMDAGRKRFTQKLVLLK